MHLRRKRPELEKHPAARTFDTLDVLRILKNAPGAMTAQQIARTGELLDFLSPGQVFALLRMGEATGMIRRERLTSRHGSVVPAYTLTAAGALRLAEEGQEG